MLSWFMNLFTGIDGGGLAPWVAGITAVVTAATAITAITPTKRDDKIINKLLAVLNFLAGNFGRNKNADAVTPPKAPDA